jgi:integrase-like protein
VLERRDLLKEAQTVIESWRTHYNTRRPHSALGYRPPYILPQLDEPLAMNCLSHRLVQKIGQAKGGDPGWRFKIPKPPVNALARFGKAAYASAAET